MATASDLRKAAIAGDTSAAARVLDEGVAVNDADCNGWTALMLAARYGQIEMITLLRDSGADMDLKNGAGRTALHWAIKKRHLAALETLLACGANPNLPYLNEYSVMMTTVVDLSPQCEVQYPLIESVRGGDREVTELLIACPATDPDVADELGNTAIMYASSMGSNDVVRRLHQRGADINAVSKSGGSSLLAAMFFKKFDTASLLLDLGADPDVKTTITGDTPLGYALKFRQKRLQKIIESRLSNKM